jgi:endoglucanase
MIKISLLTIIAISLVTTVIGTEVYANDNQRSYYTTMSNKIYRNSKEIKLNGINWFGAEEKETLVPHGLWSRNYKEMIKQTKELGFNAFRIPFCPQTIQNKEVYSISYNLNPDLKDKKSLEVFDKILEELRNQGMYFILDHHRPDCQSISELWYTNDYSEQQWIDDLKTIANRYRNNQYFVGIDLKNEPHGKATWSDLSYSTDWNKAAQRAGKAILNDNPSILLYIEGIAENVVNNKSVCDSAFGKFWGGNLSPVLCYPLDSFELPKNKVVYSPHIYGPDVHMQEYFNDKNMSNLTQVWNSHFGFLVDQGYTVSIGEFGGFYRQGSKDRQWQDKLIDYLIDKKICNTFYWSLNPNSQDTGGILKDDWITVNYDKVSNLTRLYRACNNNLLSNNEPLSFASNQNSIVKYQKTSSFKDGDNRYNECGNFYIANNTDSVMSNWRLNFNADINVNKQWSARYLNNDTNWLVIPDQPWSRRIQPRSTIDIGFCFSDIKQLGIKNIKIY